MNVRRTAYGVVAGLGLVTAAYGLFMLASPMLLEPEHVGPLLDAGQRPEVRALLLFASFQMAMLTIAWGAFVAGLARPALLARDRLAAAALWIGGVGVGLGTAARMALVGDWVGVAFNAVPIVLLAAALVAPLFESVGAQPVPVREPARATQPPPREEPPRPR